MAIPGPAPEPANQGAVAGLARELEEVGRLVRKLNGLPAQVAELGAVVAQMADELAANAAPTGTVGPTSWLALPPEGGPSMILGDLADWLARIYLRFPDGLTHLPECWLWHADVVEELLWLRLAWAVAYHPELGTPMLAGDWHERYRPGVVRRIRDRAGTCSLERHRDDSGNSAPLVPLTEAIDAISVWWGEDRGGPAPVPSAELLDIAARSRRWAGGRR